MNKKALIAFWAFLSSIPIYATQKPHSLLNKRHNIKTEGAILSCRLLRKCSEMDFKDKKLPQDLGCTNLTNANFTGKHFTYTKLTGAQLPGAILKNTTCDYQKCFQDNVKINKLSGGKKLRKSILKDLKYITKIYCCTCSDREKAVLIQMASHLAYLPYCEDFELYIKIAYWSCRLFFLSKQLNNLGDHLSSTLHSSQIAHHAETYCWKTDYPAHLEDAKGQLIAVKWCRATTSKSLPNVLGIFIQDYLTEPAAPQQPIHADFDMYLQLFQKGVMNYNVRSKKYGGDHFYKETIIENIQGLKKAYPKLISQPLKEEAIDIAHTLSKCYKFQHLDFLWYYLTCQYRLIIVKQLAGSREGKYIHFENHCLQRNEEGWHLN